MHEDGERKIHAIPRTDYIDGMPEARFIPIDDLIVTMMSFVLAIWIRPPQLRMFTT